MRGLLASWREGSCRRPLMRCCCPAVSACLQVVPLHQRRRKPALPFCAGSGADAFSRRAAGRWRRGVRGRGGGGVTPARAARSSSHTRPGILLLYRHPFVPASYTSSCMPSFSSGSQQSLATAEEISRQGGVAKGEHWCAGSGVDESGTRSSAAAPRASAEWLHQSLGVVWVQQGANWRAGRHSQAPVPSAAHAHAAATLRVLCRSTLGS